MERVWDSHGEARAALERVVSGFGAAVLGQADMLEGLLQDDVPQLPREVAMLTETARHGVAGMLTERVRQGISAPAAVTMVATEMTSRTAVDAAGALWAAGVFAHLIGLGPSTTMPPVPPGQLPADVTLPPSPVQSTQQDSGAAVTTGHNQVADAVSSDQPTRIVADAFGPGSGPGSGQVAGQGTAALLGAATSPTGLVVVAAAGSIATVLLISSWVLTGFSESSNARNYVEILPLLAGGIAFAVWAARSGSSGAGLGAVLGFAAPAIAFAIYDAAIAAELTSESAIKRYFVVGASVLAVLTAGAALAAATAALARWRLLGAPRPDRVAVLTALLGLAFVLCSLFGQLSIDGFLVDNVEGPGIRGWDALWGLAFLAFYALPPLASLFIAPGSPARKALWSGWLVVVLAWQISDSPIDNLKPAYGLYLTWACWLAVLVATIAMAARQPARRPQQNPWQPL